MNTCCSQSPPPAGADVAHHRRLATTMPTLLRDPDFYSEMVNYVTNGHFSLEVDAEQPTEVDFLCGADDYDSMMTQLFTKEKDERQAIDDLYLEVSTVTAFKVIELNVKGSNGKYLAEAATALFTDHIRESYDRKARTFAESNFDDIFPEGIAGRLSDFDVMHLVDIVMGLPLMVDGDMQTIRFAFNPSITLRADSFPKDFGPFFYSHIAAKSALSLANLSIPEWHDWFHTYFYHRQQFERTSPLPVAIAITTMMNALQLFDIERPRADSHIVLAASSDSASRQAFYQYCLDIENSRKGDRSDRDDENSINIEFQRGELLGQGGFGKVYRVTNVETGALLALKELPLDDAKDHAIRAEIATLQRLSHKNIVKYYGARFDRERKRVGILMEYLPRNLREVAMASPGGLSLKLVATYGTMILEGLTYLHEHGILHGDVKSSNVLLSSEGIAKLTDFGTAMHNASATEVALALEAELAAFDEETRGALKRQREANEKSRRQRKRHIVGTPLYLDPSVLRGALPSEASDIWALGLLFLELITKRPPWPELAGLPLEVVLYRISCATTPPQLPHDIDVTDEFRAMLRRVLAMNPFDRPSARELLDDPFFAPATGLTAPGLTEATSSNSENSPKVSGAQSDATTSPLMSVEVVGPSQNCAQPAATGSGHDMATTTLQTETMLLTTKSMPSP